MVEGLYRYHPFMRFSDEQSLASLQAFKRHQDRSFTRRPVVKRTPRIDRALFHNLFEGKLPSHLSREGLILFSGGRTTARDLVKKRLKAFNEAFDNIYKIPNTTDKRVLQTDASDEYWAAVRVILEKDLREKTCHLIIQAIVPVYRSYMQNYGPLVEQDSSASKYAKFTAQSLEKMLTSLFLPKPMRHGSFKVRQHSSKFSNGVEDQYSASPTLTIASA